LTSTRITEKSGKYLALLKNLKILTLQETNINENALDHLLNLEKLEVLNISKCKISSTAQIIFNLMDKKVNIIRLDMHEGKKFPMVAEYGDQMGSEESD